MRRSFWTRSVALFLCATLLLTGCTQWAVKRELQPLYDVAQKGGVHSGDQKSYLMAHMMDGSVYVFDEWDEEPGARLTGLGRMRDANRRLIHEGEISVWTDSVALFETNQMVHRIHPAVIVGAVAIAAIAIAVAASGKKEEQPPPPPPPPSSSPPSDPGNKTMFGSCPTFYLRDGTQSVLRAEGFSASVARVLEATDVDALDGVRPQSREFDVVMKNEALETHVVRHVDLLAAPRTERGRVFATPDGSFWQASEILEPSRCVAPEGDCTSALQARDGLERFSAADSTDLATRETVEIEFADVPEGRWGFVLASRQSLLGTFLFYRALAAMGSSAGWWLAELERGNPLVRERSQGMWKAMGGIEVSASMPGSRWQSAGEIDETGPLASDVRVLPLAGHGGGPVKIKLHLARGDWRLDYVALARLESPVEPIRLAPTLVCRGEATDESALAALRDRTSPLVTLPGDEFTLRYLLPEDFDAYELFLESRGYYYEWIREEWLADENPDRAALMLLNPEQALRVLAPEYKRVERQWEAQFWSSRYVRR